MKKLFYFIFLFSLLTITYSCIEEYNAATEEFEDVIVIEANITNEFKNHKITLTRTYKFEQNNPSAESGAIINITASNNKTYTFNESSLGVYISNTKFQAEPNVDYKLSIKTKNGREYASTNTKLTNVSSIDNLYALKEVNEDGIEGVGIYVDSFDSTNSTKYYGYEFEETYKIVSPLWISEDLILLPSGGFSVVPKTQEEEICYNTIQSKGRLLTDTNLLQEDRVSKFLLKFIPSDDISLNTRYSILVKQFIQSRESYNYIKVLEDFSSSQSLFSQIQPGFLASNIFSVSNTNEKVLGFFEVSSVSEKRIFFDRLEVLDEPFPWLCTPYAPTTFQLRSLIRNDKVNLVVDYGPGVPGRYEVARRECGDCTALGSNIKPSFWVD